MTVVKGCIIAAIALTAGGWAEVARADEAYICDAGRVVYVKPGQLETMKHEDPCIAKYFEQTPSVKPAARAAQVEAAAEIKTRIPNPVGDFRNVRVINAGPGSDAWFQHRR
jgi:hypothetical protein